MSRISKGEFDSNNSQYTGIGAAFGIKKENEEVMDINKAIKDR